MSGAEATPNILLIVTDQQRGDAIGAVSPWMKTPALDRLAREGTVFRRCITQSPGCIPARAALATGLYAHNTAVWHARPFTLPATARTWIRRVREAGYRTSMIGKTHLHQQSGDLRDRAPLLRSWGFDDVIEISGPRVSLTVGSEMTDEWEAAGVLAAYREDLRARTGAGRFAVRPSPLGIEHHYDVFVGRRAGEQIRSFGSDRPWFCWVGFAGPHEPWDAPEPYFDLYDPQSVPDPLPGIRSAADGRPRGALLDDRLATDAERLGPLDAGQLAAIRANYAAKVSLIDAQVEGLLAAVEARGELDRTLVVFTSDHGEMNGDHGLIHKSCFLEGALTVPLIVRLPTALGRGPSSVAAPVELIDVGPTLADVAGSPVEYPQWGRSLWPILHGDSESVRELALSEQRGEVMITDRRWKIAVNQAGRVYLCTDLEEDPAELTNLAGSGEARDVERELRDRLLARILETQLMDDWC